MTNYRQSAVGRGAALVAVASLSLSLGALAQAQTQTQASAETQTTAGASASASSGGLEEVVVTGIRKSLESATNAKRDSVVFQDSIFAEDIGSCRPPIWRRPSTAFRVSP